MQIARPNIRSAHTIGVVAARAHELEWRRSRASARAHFPIRPVREGVHLRLRVVQHATVEPSGSGAYSLRDPLRFSAITSPLIVV